MPERHIRSNAIVAEIVHFIEECRFLIVDIDGDDALQRWLEELEDWGFVLEIDLFRFHYDVFIVGKEPGKTGDFHETRDDYIRVNNAACDE